MKMIFPALCLFFTFAFCVPTIAFGQQGNSTITHDSDMGVNSRPDLSGLYVSDSQDKYFLRQVNDSLWWVGTDKNGSHILNVFNGVIEGNGVRGHWIDSPLEKTAGAGSLNLYLSYASPDNITLATVSNDLKFPASRLVKYIPDTLVIPKFMVALDSVNAEIPRSPIHDTLYVGLSAKKGGNDPLTATKYVANSEGGSNVTLGLTLGPFELDKKDDGLTLIFMGVDNEGSRTPPTLINLGETLIELFDPSFNSYDLSNMYQTDLVARSLSPGLLSGGCNGLVFADKVFLSVEELEKMMSNGIYSQEKSYVGTASPPGCGPNSKYHVKWSIVPVE